MSNILVISDTHGNLSLLDSVLSANIECEIIIHLGDNYDDLDNFSIMLEGKKIYKVPGIFHPDYLNGKLPPEQIIEVNDKKILMVHSKNDISKNADIYLFGHTHEWEVRNNRKGVFLNPGHLRMTKDRGRIASYALLGISNDKFHIKLLDYGHKKFLEATI